MKEYFFKNWWICRNYNCLEVEKNMAAKKPFGGYTICFKGCDDTAEKIFGSEKIAPSEMTKKIWAYVKKQGIAGK